MMGRLFAVCMVVISLAATSSLAQQGPLRIEITEGVIEPLPFAAPSFQPESAQAAELAANIARVVAADLKGTGLFREIPASAYISTISDFAAPVQFAD